MKNSTNKQAIDDFFYHYNLQIWWQAAFTEQERRYIEEKVRSDHTPGNTDEMQKNATGRHRSVVGFLAELAHSFRRPPERSIANRILDKAESLLDDDTHVIDAHVLYDRMIAFAFSYHDPAISSLDRTMRACEYQILLAADVASELSQQGPLPEHRGFRQLAMIREQEEDYRGVISLCQEARQQGWPGDWEEKITRCKKILADQLLSQGWCKNQPLVRSPHVDSAAVPKI